MCCVEKSDYCSNLLVGLHVDPPAISALTPDQPEHEQASDGAAWCKRVVQLPTIRLCVWGFRD
jgi:hypothetical protein